MRSIKMLGLALVAVLAVSGIVATGASATTFQAETYPAKIEGKATNTQVFKTESGNVECTVSNGKGELTAASEWLLTSITWEKCTFATYGSATIEVGTCKFEFHTIGSMDIVTASCVITVRTLTCVVKVFGQTGLKTVKYVNLGSGSTREVEVQSNLEKMKYEEGSGCLKPGTHENGTYTGIGKDKAINGLGVQEGTWVG